MSAAEVFPDNETSCGFSERRSSLRFHIERTVRCKSGNRVPRFGRTIDISRRGVSFTIEDPPALGQPVELTVDWPVRLNGQTRVNLVIFGRVVRHSPSSAVVAITRHEFRTVGSQGLICMTGS